MEKSISVKVKGIGATNAEVSGPSLADMFLFPFFPFPYLSLYPDTPFGLITLRFAFRSDPVGQGTPSVNTQAHRRPALNTGEFMKHTSMPQVPRSLVDIPNRCFESPRDRRRSLYTTSSFGATSFKSRTFERLICSWSLSASLKLWFYGTAFFWPAVAVALYKL